MYKNKMKNYCVKCRKDTENIDPKIVRKRKKKLIEEKEIRNEKLKKELKDEN